MPEAETPTATLIEHAVNDLREIVRSEMRLAAVELKEKAIEAGSGGAMMAAGATMALFGGGCFVLLGYKALSRITRSPILSAFLLGAGLEAAAFMLTKKGVEVVRRVELKPTETIRSVKQDLGTVAENVR